MKTQPTIAQCLQAACKEEKIRRNEIIKLTSKCLRNGLLIDSKKRDQIHGDKPAFMLGALSYVVGELIEGSAESKKWARADLKRIIAIGRTAANAEAFNAGLKKGHAKSPEKCQAIKDWS